MDPIEMVLRWVHIVPAVLLTGGILYQWLESSDPDDNDERLEAKRRKWSKVVMFCTGPLLISGLANTARAAMTYDLPMHYNMVLLVKMVLALGVFYLAALLAGCSESAK